MTWLEMFGAVFILLISAAIAWTAWELAREFVRSIRQVGRISRSVYGKGAWVAFMLRHPIGSFKRVFREFGSSYSSYVVNGLVFPYDPTHPIERRWVG